MDHPKYRLFSAHDSNIASWMDVLNPSMNWGDVAFAEPIHIELYEKSNEFYVRMLLNGIPLALEKCGGKVYCSAKEF